MHVQVYYNELVAKRKKKPTKTRGKKFSVKPHVGMGL